MRSGLTQPGPPVLGMVLKGFPRISETFISNEILLLEELGCRIRIFSMRHPREAFAHESVKRIRAWVDYLPQTLVGNEKMLFLANARAITANPRAYLRTFKTAARRYLKVSHPATFRHFLQGGYLAGQLLPGSGVTHLHAHFAHSPTSVAMYAAGIADLKFSFTAHAKDIYTSDPGQLAEKLHKARFAVTCTDYNRRYLESLAADGLSPIYRIYHGIDLGLFQSRAEKHEIRPPYRILTVARLTAKKGLPTVYHALRRLLDQGLAVQHTLIGDGDDRDSVLSLIKRLGLEHNTEWLGTQPHDVVLQHYAQADLFVLGCEVTDNGDRDGIPNVLLESMAMGVPVVATRVSAIPELVENERTGLLAPSQSPDDLAEAMKRLLTDHDLRGRIIPAARERVLADFDNRKWTRELAGIFDRSRGCPA